MLSMAGWAGALNVQVTRLQAVQDKHVVKPWHGKAGEMLSSLATNQRAMKDRLDRIEAKVDRLLQNRWSNE